jgi:CRISPR-associated protein Csy2
MHALQRKVNQNGLPNVKFYSVAVVSHKLDLQTYKGTGDYVYSIIGTGNPLVPKKKRKKGEPWDLFERPPFIEEARCHLEASMIIEYSPIAKDEEDLLLSQIAHHLNASMKIAGGHILSFKKPTLHRLEEGNDQELRRLTRQLMPGYAIIERRELIIDAMEQGQDAMEALLDYLVVNHSCEKDDSSDVTWTSRRKTAGWIVPIAAGFHGITELGAAKNQRDPETPHRFAESVVTLGEFRMPHRIQSIDDILWCYHTDTDKNLYLCRQNSQLN